MSLSLLSSAVRSGFDTVMTTPQHDNQGAHFPERRPRPLEIILNGSDGECKPKLFLVSLRLLTIPRCRFMLNRHSRSRWLSADRRTLDSPFRSVCLPPHPVLPHF